MKPKILICGILPPPYFGHSMIYKVLMESEFPKQFDVVFFNMKFWSYQQHKKVTILKLLKMAQYFFQYIFLILKEKPKYVLYAMSFDRMPFLKDFLFCAVGRILGCRIVLHDMGQYLPELYNASGRVYRRLIKMFMNMVTATIVLGDVTRRTYEGFLPLEHAFAAHGSVEDSRHNGYFRPQKNAGEPVSVLYFSFLSVTKGVRTALHAIPHVVRRNPKVSFVFAGPFESPALQKEFEQFVEDNRLSGKVRHVGYVGDDEERTRMFREADIFIFPTHRDVFGLVLLHAMAEELPVVASIEGAIPEIVGNGINGLLFPKGNPQELAEKILELAEDPQKRKVMGAANRRRFLDHYTPEKYGERIKAAFDGIEQMNRD